MATRPALVGDPTALSAAGEYLGFSMLPFVADSFHDEHFPKYSGSSETEISRGKVAAIFRRAWVPGAGDSRSASTELNKTGLQKRLSLGGFS